MKKRLLVIATVIFLGLGYSCEDSLDEVINEQIIEVQNENDDDPQEEELPPVRESELTS